MNRLLLASAALSLVVLTGCDDKAAYKDAGGTETVVSLDKINIQDFAQASDKLVQSLQNSEIFATLPAGKRPVVAMSTIKNDTSTQFDTDLFTTKFNAALLKTKKFQVSSTVAAGGRAADNFAKELRQQDDFAAGRDTIRKSPDYTLAGKILEDQASAGRTKQATYIFQLTLTEVSSGNAVWIDEAPITKQGTKNAVGF